MLRYILNVGAGRQDERPRQAEVGEQRLALLGKQRLAVTKQRQRDVARARPIMRRQAGSGLTRLHRLGCGGMIVCPACRASL